MTACDFVPKFRARDTTSAPATFSFLCREEVGSVCLRNAGTHLPSRTVTLVILRPTWELATLGQIFHFPRDSLQLWGSFSISHVTACNSEAVFFISHVTACKSEAVFPFPMWQLATMRQFFPFPTWQLATLRQFFISHVAACNSEAVFFFHFPRDSLQLWGSFFPFPTWQLATLRQFFHFPLTPKIVTMPG